MAAVGGSSLATLFRATAVATRCMHYAHKGPNASGVCVLLNSPQRDAMRPCKTCKHWVHVACTVQVPYPVEVICKVCAPKAGQSPPPTTKHVRRRLNPQWRVSRSWLHFENGVMLCLPCTAYPQTGLQKVRLDSTPQVRKCAVVARGNSGVHAVAIGWWESGVASATVIGGLPLAVRWAIFGLFHVVNGWQSGTGHLPS